VRSSGAVKIKPDDTVKAGYKKAPAPVSRSVEKPFETFIYPVINTV
jgi:hypothetical protein